MLDIKKTGIRALSGAVYVAMIVLACWCGAPGLTLLALLFGALGMFEFRQMRFGPQGASLPLTVYDIFGICCLILSAYWLPLLMLWVTWMMGRMVITIYSRADHPEKQFAVDMAGQVYIGIPLFIMTLMAKFCDLDIATCMPVLSIFILIWVNDTGAFIFGSIFGRHKLFERVSPKKSWEGFWGGALCAIGGGALIGATGTDLAQGSITDPLWFWLGAGAVIAVAATFGDLFESVIKRNLHIKDSGNIMPGHGGILDRIDSLLMVLPAMLLYFLIYNCTALMTVLPF